MFPDILFVGFVSGMVTYYNAFVILVRHLDFDGDGIVTMDEIRKAMTIDSAIHDVHSMGMDFLVTDDMFTLPLQPFTLSSIALGMMLTFRTQNSNSRYTEARQHWGAMVNESRAVAGRILGIVHQHEGEAARARVHALKCVMTFPHTLKYHLTVDGFCPDLHVTTDMTNAELEASKGLAIRKEMRSIWDFDDALEKGFVDRLLAKEVGSRPLHVLHELAAINAQVFKKPATEGGAGLDSVETTEIFRSITRFQDVLGACERLYKTPIYTGYTRFMSRTVFIWCNALPLALYPIMGPVGTVPCSMIVALFMYGLEDVGTRIEQPFDALPLWQYCDGIDGSVQQMMAQHQAIRKDTC